MLRTIPTDEALRHDTVLRQAYHPLNSIFFTLGTLSIAIRVYSRWFIVRQFGWEDWIMATVFFFNVVLQSVFVVMGGLGAGLDLEVVQESMPNELAVLPKYLFFLEIYYVWMQLVIKASVLFFYLRLSPFRPYRIAVFSTMGFNVVETAAAILVYIFQCKDIRSVWDPTIPKECLSNKFLYFFAGSLNLLVDIIIFILPMPTLFKLQTSLRRRMTAMAIMGFGSVAIIISALRLQVLYEFVSNPNFTYLLGKIIIMTSAEVDVMIIAANLPSFKALWVKGFGLKAFWDSSARRSKKGDSEGYEMSGHVSAMGEPRISKPRKEPGIDTELGLEHDSQEELFHPTATREGWPDTRGPDGLPAGEIRVVREFEVSRQDSSTERTGGLQDHQRKMYFNVGRG